jgi:hypothetical protein
MTVKHVTVNGKPLVYCSICGRRKYEAICQCMLPPKAWNPGSRRDRTGK